MYRDSEDARTGRSYDLPGYHQAGEDGRINWWRQVLEYSPAWPPQCPFHPHKDDRSKASSIKSLTALREIGGSPARKQVRVGKSTPCYSGTAASGPT